MPSSKRNKALKRKFICEYMVGSQGVVELLQDHCRSPLAARTLACSKWLRRLAPVIHPSAKASLAQDGLRDDDYAIVMPWNSAWDSNNKLPMDAKRQVRALPLGGDVVMELPGGIMARSVSSAAAFLIQWYGTFLLGGLGRRTVVYPR